MIGDRFGLRKNPHEWPGKGLLHYCMARRLIPLHSIDQTIPPLRTRVVPSYGAWKRPAARTAYCNQVVHVKFPSEFLELFPEEDEDKIGIFERGTGSSLPIIMGGYKFMLLLDMQLPVS